MKMRRQVVCWVHGDGGVWQAGQCGYAAIVVQWLHYGSVALCMWAQFADRVPDERLRGWARVKKPNRAATPCQAPTTMRWSYRVPLAFWFLGLVRLGPAHLQDHTGGPCVGVSLQVGCRQFDGHLRDLCLASALPVWDKRGGHPAADVAYVIQIFHALRQKRGCITSAI